MVDQQQHAYDGLRTRLDDVVVKQTLELEAVVTDVDNIIKTQVGKTSGPGAKWENRLNQALKTMQDNLQNAKDSILVDQLPKMQESLSALQQAAELQVTATKGIQVRVGILEGDKKKANLPPVWWYTNFASTLLSASMYSGEGLAAAISMLSSSFLDTTLSVEEDTQVRQGMASLSRLIMTHVQKKQPLTLRTIAKCAQAFLPPLPVETLEKTIKVKIIRWLLKSKTSSASA